MSHEHVIVGMSGGIDSAVAAWKLRQDGYRVSGLFMFNWTADEEGYCNAADDFHSAKAVCDELDIALHRADFSIHYRQRVFNHFLEGYKAGKTPNPDLLCNREIKFQPFRDYAFRLGADLIATGHYAQIEYKGDHGPQLIRAVDENKDQTYFLASVRRECFDRVLFPIGHLTKPQVREIGRRAGLPNHARRDSTGICFIGERQFRDFLGTYIATQPGPIEDETGQYLGQHPGLPYYTLGQRRGLAIGGIRNAKEGPWYVIAKDHSRNALIVSQDPRHPRLLSRHVTVSAFNWLKPQDFRSGTMHARIRHRQDLQRCQVTVTDDPGRLCITFEQPQRAAVPGQYAVLYDDRRCIGAGEIEDAH